MPPSGPDAPRYTARARAERVIALVRVALASLTLLAGWVDPFTPARFVDETYLLLTLYLVYSLVLAVAVSRSRTPNRFGFPSHVADLVLFPIMVYLTEGFASPLFVYLIFAIMSGMLRWQTRGLVGTAVAVFIIFNTVGFLQMATSLTPGLDLNRLIIRNSYVVGISVMLASVGVLDTRLRGEMARLASWPRTRAPAANVQLTEVLAYAAETLAAPRVLLLWEETDEPWRHIALWSRGTLVVRREAPGTYTPIASAALAQRPFFCEDASREDAAVLVQTERRIEVLHRGRLNQALREELSLGAVLHVPMRGASTSGHFMALDRHWMTTDDFALGEVVTRLVAASLDEWLAHRLAQETAATAERLRLATELHDGVVQSLVGAAFQLRAAQDVADTDPAEMRERLGRVERLIAEEQRDLRFLLGVLREHPEDAEHDGGLETRLRGLARQVESVWGMETEFDLDPALSMLPPAVRLEAYSLVREALINAARHAQAARTTVAITCGDDWARIRVADQGQGFSFHGTYDQDALKALRLGPISLRDRVGRTGGTLVIRSSASGAEIDVTLPVSREAVPSAP